MASNARPPLLALDAALAQLLATVPATAQRQELLATLEADGRVLAQDVVSHLEVPPQDNSSMDGYALRCADVQSGRTLPVSQRIAAGMAGALLQVGTAARIFTGAPIPPGADAVVMQEDCVLTPASGDGGEAIAVQTAPPPANGFAAGAKTSRAMPPSWRVGSAWAQPPWAWPPAWAWRSCKWPASRV